MVLKRYTKIIPYSDQELTVQGGAYSFLSLLGAVFVFIGSIILASQIFSPFLSLASDFSYLKPVSEEYFTEATEKQQGFAFRELADGLSEEGEGQISAVVVPELVYLSIPKLGISEALVEINSDNLAPDTRLGHLKGSALPSEAGEVFIYGHSTLPVLFNPSNYKTIFSTLDKLSSGDVIEISLSGQTYKYAVKRLEIIPPHEVKPVLKRTLKETLTLVTCFPFGTTKDRLLVHAERVYQ